MALRRNRLVALLATSLTFAAGCGGCDSCFGSASPTDDAAVPIATRTVAPAAVDASPSASDASREGAADAGASTRDATAIPVPTVARPKAPMPLGAFQTCGVYDGPLCEKACPKGACRQECDAVRCDLTCAAGYCSQVCGSQGTCKLSCAGGHCIQLCVNPEGCTKDCAGGSCE